LQLSTKGYTDSPSPYDRMQLILKGPTNNTQISSPTSRSEVPHKHRQHHKASSGITSKHFKGNPKKSKLLKHSKTYRPNTKYFKGNLWKQNAK